MDPSSILCRKQEAMHRQKATETALDNVRVIAERAADAWANEALIAERRERRRAVPVPASETPAGWVAFGGRATWHC